MCAMCMAALAVFLFKKDYDELWQIFKRRHEALNLLSSAASLSPYSLHTRMVYSFIHLYGMIFAFHGVKFFRRFTANHVCIKSTTCTFSHN